MADCACSSEPIIKVNQPRFLGQSNKIIEARAEGFAGRISAWMLRYARFLARQEIARLRGRPSFINTFGKDEAYAYRILKAGKDEERFRAQLSRIMETHGVRQLKDSARRKTGEKEIALPSRALADFVRTKEIRITGIMRESNKAVQDSLRGILGSSLNEQPRPSAGEIARRIRSQFHGIEGGTVKPGDSGIEVRGDHQLSTQLFRPLTTVNDPKRRGALYAFSSERAALIARTELVQAENTGAFEGYKAIGVKWKQWLAYTDGKSGARKHHKMNKKIKRIDEPFILPSRVEMMFPGDPQGPIGEIANCRCSLSSFRRGVPKR